MMRRLLGPLPEWARREHPVMRFELGQPSTDVRRVQWWKVLGAVVLALVLLGAGYLAATNGLTRPPGQTPTESLHAVVYLPLLAIQIATGILALTLTANAIGDETRQHWDSLRATPRGTELALRARWAAVFYRLRWLLAAILLVRVVLVLGMLYDLTGFQGRYLDLLLNGTLPEMSLAGGVLLLSLLMTAALLLPVTGVALDAAFGLMLSIVIEKPTYRVMVQTLLVLVRVAVVAILGQTLVRFSFGVITLEQPSSALLVGAYGALGDGGLAYLNLGLYGGLWSKAPWSILVSLALLVFALVQALLSDYLLNRTVRIAERRG